MSCVPVEVEQLVIGDDYLKINDRAITVNFCPINNFTPASCVAKLGFDDSEGNTLLVTGGVVTDNGDGTWKASIDITNIQSATLVPNVYDWSVEVSQGGIEYTVAKSFSNNTKIRWVAKQT